MSSLKLALVAEIWDAALRETPDPLSCDLFADGRRLSYRQRLDRQPINFHGAIIPRIVTVRRNLRALGKPKRAPRLPA